MRLNATHSPSSPRLPAFFCVEQSKMAAEEMAAADAEENVISVGLSEGNIDTIILLNDLV